MRNAVKAEFYNRQSCTLCIGDGGCLAYSMDGLMDHGFGKFKLLVLLIIIDILGDHCDGFMVRTHALSPTVHWTTIFIIGVKCTDSRRLADASIALSTGAFVFPELIERLQKQKDGYTDHSNQQKDCLDYWLSSIQLFAWFYLARLQEHVNKHIQQSGCIVVHRSPIDCPFVDDGENKVPKYRLEENHSRHKVTPYVDWALEMACVNER